MNKVKKQPYKKPQAVKDMEAFAWEVKRQQFPTSAPTEESDLPF